MKNIYREKKYIFMVQNNYTQTQTLYFLTVTRAPLKTAPESCTVSFCLNSVDQNYSEQPHHCDVFHFSTGKRHREDCSGQEVMRDWLTKLLHRLHLYGALDTLACGLEEQGIEPPTSCLVDKALSHSFDVVVGNNTVFRGYVIRQ